MNNMIRTVKATLGIKRYLPNKFGLHYTRVIEICELNQERPRIDYLRQPYKHYCTFILIDQVHFLRHCLLLKKNEKTQWP